MIKTILLKLFVYGLALFYAWLLAITYFIKWIKDPSKKFWRVQRRDVPPECLSDPVYGQHSYKQLKVRVVYVLDNFSKLFL